jgi:hypothetical protein
MSPRPHRGAGPDIRVPGVALADGLAEDIAALAGSLG